MSSSQDLIGFSRSWTGGSNENRLEIPALCLLGLKGGSNLCHSPLRCFYDTLSRFFEREVLSSSFSLQYLFTVALTPQTEELMKGSGIYRMCPFQLSIQGLAKWPLGKLWIQWIHHEPDLSQDSAYYLAPTSTQTEVCNLFQISGDQYQFRPWILKSSKRLHIPFPPAYSYPNKWPFTSLRKDWGFFQHSSSLGTIISFSQWIMDLKSGSDIPE